MTSISPSNLNNEMAPVKSKAPRRKVSTIPLSLVLTTNSVGSTRVNSQLLNSRKSISSTDHSMQRPAVTSLDNLCEFNESALETSPSQQDLEAKNISVEDSLAKKAEQSKLCEICYTFSEKEESCVLSCKHQFCKNCLGTYLKKEIEGFNVEEIECPKDDCKTVVGENKIEEILSKGDFVKYEAVKATKVAIQDITTMTCPTFNCLQLLNVDRSKEYTQCPCGTFICNKCLQPKHNGYTCAKVAMQNTQLYAKNKALKHCLACDATASKIPKSLHSKCTSCDYEWCRECGKEWTIGHSRRCSKLWQPDSPQAMDWKRENILKRLSVGLLVLPKATLYFVVCMLTIGLLWPFAGYNMVLLKSKKPYLNKLVNVLIGMLIWPLAAVAIPVMMVDDRYGHWFRKKDRWINRNFEYIELNTSNKTKSTNNLSSEDLNKAIRMEKSHDLELDLEAGIEQLNNHDVRKAKGLGSNRKAKNWESQIGIMNLGQLY